MLSFYFPNKNRHIRKTVRVDNISREMGKIQATIGGEDTKEQNKLLKTERQISI